MQCSFDKTIDLPGGGFQRSQCIAKAGILIINDPCYGLCYTCAYRKLQIENKRLGEFEKAIKSRHNGYGPDVDCEEPKTPIQALDELLGEAELLGYSKREIELTNEHKRLREALEKYGKHKSNCNYIDNLQGNVIEDCDCGFEQALSGQKG